MSIRQIMKSSSIICSVPDQRKATAVRDCVEEEVNSMYPASVLQQHSQCFLFLDKQSASQLSMEKANRH
jgi:glucosamine-6-phosphate deaminase